MGNNLPPVPFNPLAPERLRDYLLKLKQAIETKGVAVTDAGAIAAQVTTETADGTYSSNEQDMLNNLKADVTSLKSEVADLKTQLNELLASIRTVGIIEE
jgi:hypothetical protein